ncbi:MAG: BON domain-containing protein [Parachlamydia sp.]|nr:BON domain-containing protein [Parachlamydia sp.]
MFKKFGKNSLGFLTVALSMMCVTGVYADYNREQGYAMTGTTVSDQDLLNKVQDKVSSGWFSKGNKNINVQVNNGVVTLQGFVKTESEKDKIEREVRNIDGVSTLISKLTVQDARSGNASDKPYTQDTYATPADDQLNKKIRDKTSRGWLWNSYKEVILNTNNGSVTLTGMVDSAKDQQKLLKEIQKVEGVRSVQSRLTIKNP